MGARYQDTEPSKPQPWLLATFIGLTTVGLVVIILAIWGECHVESVHGWKNDRTTIGVITRIGYTPARKMKNGKFTNYADEEWFIQVEDELGTKIWSGRYLARFVRTVKEGEKVSINHADRYTWTVHPFKGESNREFVMDEILQITPVMPLESDSEP